jgi:hypothetical protein
MDGARGLRGNEPLDDIFYRLYLGGVLNTGPGTPNGFIGIAKSRVVNGLHPF